VQPNLFGTGSLKKPFTQPQSTTERNKTYPTCVHLPNVSCLKFRVSEGRLHLLAVAFKLLGVLGASASSDTVPLAKSSSGTSSLQTPMHELYGGRGVEECKAFQVPLFRSGVPVVQSSGQDLGLLQGQGRQAADCYAPLLTALQAVAGHSSCR